MEEEHLANHFLGFFLDGAKGHSFIVEVMKKDNVLVDGNKWINA